MILFKKIKNNQLLPIFDLSYFIYNNKQYCIMKNKDIKKLRVSITLDPKIIDFIDDDTANRSHLINWLLKEHFGKLGKDVSKIKL